MPTKEKCLEDAHLHLGATLKRDLQDLAMRQDRSFGESLRAVLEQHGYRVKGMLLSPNPSDQAH